MASNSGRVISKLHANAEVHSPLSVVLIGTQTHTRFAVKRGTFCAASEFRSNVGVVVSRQVVPQDLEFRQHVKARFLSVHREDPPLATADHLSVVVARYDASKKTNGTQQSEHPKVLGRSPRLRKRCRRAISSRICSVFQSSPRVKGQPLTSRDNAPLRCSGCIDC